MPVLGSPVCGWLLCLSLPHASWQCLSLTLQKVSDCYTLMCFKPADSALSLALQGVSGCYALMYFKPTDKAFLWLFRLWVAVVPWCVSSLLTMPVFDSSGCKWLLCLDVNSKPADHACPLLFSLWVAAVLCCVSECWQCSLMVLQFVSDYCVSVCFKPANKACSWLSSKWVAAVPWFVSSMLTMPGLGSPECECLLCLDVFPVCWQCLLLALQYVSVCGALVCLKPTDNACSWLFLQGVSGCYVLMCFKPADNACSWLFSKWVTAVSCVSSLLIASIFGSAACEWLWCLSVFQVCWWYLFLALQVVGVYHTSLCLNLADSACLVFSECELLATFLGFIIADNLYLWLFTDSTYHCSLACVWFLSFLACLGLSFFILQLVSTLHMQLME